ncbi:hypothetical protein [Lentzea albidocapillata]|uniref:hypothetical protein n=1 Tax=Lentzea albidocapillata TaxID=40571 RepID=UPI00115FD271|nr:hypothetical protein [Lentzea albidocapillata]
MARTLTSAIRLLEALPVFAGDHRVQVLFTVDTRSRFSSGAVELIRGLPAHAIPWETAPDIDCDLVLAASEKIDFQPARAVPVLVLPHGVGFHKHVPDVDSAETRVSGVVAPEVLRQGGARMLVTHPDQVRHLTTLVPEAAGRTVLGGDTSFDLLTGSASVRGHYRDRLGLTGGQRLVLLTSTWSGQSLLGTHPELAERLLRELPVDEYRVAAVAHPNVWAWHGAWEVRRILDTALKSGLLLVEPTQGWHAAMIASDVVLGDHGSLSLYAAASGRPLVLAAFGDEVVDGTPMAELGRTAHRLDPAGDLRPQLDAAIREHDAAKAELVADALFALPGRALQVLRAWCYDALRLSEPDRPQPSLTCPDPREALPSVYSFEITGTVHNGATVALNRFPVQAGGHRPPPGSTAIRHVGVDVRERNLRRFADAATIVRGETDDDNRIGNWLITTLERFPGCRMTGHATPRGCDIMIRDGRRLSLHAPAALRDAGLLTSALYTLMAAGSGLPGEFELRVGDRSGTVTVSR